MGNQGLEKDTQRITGARMPRWGVPESVSAEERHQRIERAAYEYSQQRGEGEGDAVSDWLRAEADVDRELDAMEPSASNPANAAAGAEAMIDTGEVRGNSDPNRIEPDQIPQWAEKLHVSKEELRVAVRDAGAEPARVSEYLEAKKSR